MTIEPLPMLADAVIRVTVMLAAAWLVTRMMRRAAASTRHVVWASALVCAALIPFVAMVAPRWQLQAPPAVEQVPCCFKVDRAKYGRSLAGNIGFNCDR